MSNADKPSWWRSATPPLHRPTAGGRRRGRVTLLLFGGGALIAHDAVDRTTLDFDCFGPTRDAVDRL